MNIERNKANKKGLVMVHTGCGKGKTRDEGALHRGGSGS